MTAASNQNPSNRWHVGLIGYGELIIIKHSDRMLSAYAHNRKRLVAEGQAVSAGEKIGEMGRDDRNRAMLHFEIRRDGDPQDPLRFLPKLSPGQLSHP